uniref:Taste receptor type 2 n=1 Tax=Pogona vitticeps TaxID=103695 RepID=A0ABM5FI03_9SAUR
MSSAQIVALLVTVADLALGGLISNGFIVTVTIRDWTKSKRLTSSEQLLLSLGISNLCAIVALYPYYLNAVSANIVSDKSKEKLFPFSVFIVTSRFWFTAWLCVFYCVKIVNSTQSLFLWWKRKISWLIPRLLLGSLIIPFLIGCYASQNISVVLTIKSNTMTNVTNGTQGKTVKYLIDSFKFSYYIIGSGFPFLVVFFCSILVVGSLCRHICRIKGNKSSLKTLQTEAHMKAAGTVLYLLVLYILFVVAQSIATSTPLEKEAAVLVSVVMMAYSPAQAAILVMVNPKLKQAATQML